MTPASEGLRVNEPRLRADFDALAQIGGTPDGGVARPTFSDAHVEARAWFLDRAHDAGLDTAVDGAANHSAVLPGSDKAGRVLLIGSHLDSVRIGGRYDGALGVLCALEILRTVRDAGLTLPVTLEAIDFTDEEGTLLGHTGSRALAGALAAEDLQHARCGHDVLLFELERMGLTEQSVLSAQRDPGSLAGYLELHIEQGPVLDEARTDVGIVTSIVGGVAMDVVFNGDARHAGTTPIDARRDALLGAADFTLAVRETVRDFPDCVATVGDIAVEPGSYNVVPGRVTVRLECRSPESLMLRALEKELVARAYAAATTWSVRVDVQRVLALEPVPMNEFVRRTIAAAADQLELRHRPMPSGAGHDAHSLAPCTPSGVLFVPSVAGVSHAAAEHTPWRACVNGANVLLLTTLALARTVDASLPRPSGNGAPRQAVSRRGLPPPGR